MRGRHDEDDQTKKARRIERRRNNQPAHDGEAPIGLFVNSLTHKHHHHGGAVCPSYGVVSLPIGRG
jgi:hypothetical protein